MEEPWKLYISPGACSLAPHIAMRELDLPFSLVILSIKSGFPESYRLVNPKQRVPALQSTNSSVLTEVPAIMTAISQRAPTRHLMGRTEQETCRVYEWLNWLSGTLHGQAYGALLRPERFVADPALHSALKEKARQTVKECYQAIEDKLSGIHAVGEGFTAVDAFLLPFYRWGNWDLALPMETLYPKYSALFGNLLKMESVRASLKAEGILPEGELDEQRFWARVAGIRESRL